MLLIQIDEVLDPVFVHPLVEILSVFNVDEIRTVMWGDIEGL